MVARAYYFPKVRDEERRPVAAEEEPDADGPLFCVYWQGRWIPYAAARVLDVFRPPAAGGAGGAAAAERGRELGRRVRGTLFFPRAMVPANSKLSLLESPEAAVNRADARYFLAGWDGPEVQGTLVRRRMAEWLGRCHAAFDREVLLPLPLPMLPLQLLLLLPRSPCDDARV